MWQKIDIRIHSIKFDSNVQMLHKNSVCILVRVNSNIFEDYEKLNRKRKIKHVNRLPRDPNDVFVENEFWFRVLSQI